MTLQTAPIPAHQQVFDRLRGMVLFGELAPGSAVTIQGIADDLAVGMTPVREALRRLVAAGALELRGNRRVAVPELLASDIEEIDQLRCFIEPELAFRAASNMTHPEIAALEVIDTALDGALASGDVAGYLQSNYAFHNRLYSHAKAPVLASVADGLWLRFGPSMRVVCGRLGTAQLPDQHKAILAGLRGGAPEAVRFAMAQDVAQGTAQLRLSLTS
ncbi:GntR family transcriptional regulator [Roseobacteraceae bacterium S113]